MCGGIRFAYDSAFEPMLAEAYHPFQVGEFQATGVVESVFWQARPILPAVLNGTTHLFDWGNRDANLKLPKTGWVRIESLSAGKWAYLKPQTVVIPALFGVEKKVWFPITHGIRGIVVQYQGKSRVYMITQPPTEAFQALTGHDRMPDLIDQTFA